MFECFLLMTTLTFIETKIVYFQIHRLNLWSFQRSHNYNVPAYITLSNYEKKLKELEFLISYVAFHFVSSLLPIVLLVLNSLKQSVKC